MRCEKRMEVINELRRVLFYAEEGERLQSLLSVCRDVKILRPDWPRDQDFDLGLFTIGIGLEVWPLPRSFV